MPIRVPLILHPHCASAVKEMEVEVSRLAPRRILLRYFVTGGVEHIRIRRSGEAPSRGLWDATCFEAFVRGGDGAYFEFNLAPSGEWAAYRLSGYREGMEEARDVGGPRIEWNLGKPKGLSELYPPEERWRESKEHAWLVAVLELDQVHELPLHLSWRLGLSAVIEERSGRISYWALAHPTGKPDFHHPDCFALELPAARPA